MTNVGVTPAGTPSGASGAVYPRCVSTYTYVEPPAVTLTVLYAPWYETPHVLLPATGATVAPNEKRVAVGVGDRLVADASDAAAASARAAARDMAGDASNDR